MTESFPLGIIIATRQGVVRYANKAVTMITGYSMADLMTWGPMEYTKFIHAEDTAKLNHWIKKVLEGQAEQDASFYARIFTKQGEIRHIQFIPSPVPFNDEHCFLVGIVDWR